MSRVSKGIGLFPTESPQRLQELTQLAENEARDRLLPVASVPWYQPELAERAHELCDYLISHYPAFDLSFRPEAEELESVLDDFRRAA